MIVLISHLMVLIEWISYLQKEYEYCRITPPLHIFYSIKITITEFIQFATLELHVYTYLFDTKLRLYTSKRNIDSNN